MQGEAAQQGSRGAWHDAEALTKAKKGQAAAAEHLMSNIIKSLF